MGYIQIESMDPYDQHSQSHLQHMQRSHNECPQSMMTRPNDEYLDARLEEQIHLHEQHSQNRLTHHHHPLHPYEQHNLSRLQPSDYQQPYDQHTTHTSATSRALADTISQNVLQSRHMQHHPHSQSRLQPQHHQQPHDHHSQSRLEPQYMQQPYDHHSQSRLQPYYMQQSHEQHSQSRLQPQHHQQPQHDHSQSRLQPDHIQQPDNLHPSAPIYSRGRELLETGGYELEQHKVQRAQDESVRRNINQMETAFRISESDAKAKELLDRAQAEIARRRSDPRWQEMLPVAVGGSPPKQPALELLPSYDKAAPSAYLPSRATDHYRGVAAGYYAGLDKEPVRYGHPSTGFAPTERAYYQ